MVGRRGNSYLGGHSIVRIFGTAAIARPVKGAKGLKTSAEYQQEVLDQVIHVEAMKSVLRINRLSESDEIRLGTNFADWSSWAVTAKRKIQDCRIAGVVRSDRVASVLNKSGFKTKAGQIWDARLVKVFVGGTAGARNEPQQTNAKTKKRKTRKK